MPFAAIGITAAILAVWYYVSNQTPDTMATPPLSKGPDFLRASFAVPKITDTPSDETFDQGPVTNQPAASSSGVPAYSQQARDFGNTTPGAITSLQPFYGAHRDVFLPRSLRRASVPYDPSARSGCGGGCGGGCQARQSKGCGTCRGDGRGNCAASPSNAAIAPNRPIDIGKIRMDPENPPAVNSLPAQVLNLTHILANPFNAYQYGEFLAELTQGGTPAAPTYHV